MIPLRPVGVGEILDGAVTYIQRNPKATLGLSALVVAVSQGVLLLTQILYLADTRQLASMNPASIQTVGDVLAVLRWTLTGYAVTFVVTFFVTTALSGMLTAVVGEAVLGRSTTPGGVWARVTPRLPALLGAAAMITGMILVPALAVGGIGIALSVAVNPGLGSVLLVLGFIGWVVLAIWVWVTFSLATPTVMLERTGALAALGRSKRLIRGSWWRVCGIMLLAWLISLVLYYVLRAPFMIVQQLFFVQQVRFIDQVLTLPTTAGLVLLAVGGFFGGTLVNPFRAGVPALLYVDLRMRREGLDLQLQDAAGVTGRPDGLHAEPPGKPETG